MVNKSPYRYPSNKEENKLIQSLPLLADIANYFHDYFVGKKVIFCSKSSEVSIFFSSSNFMYLCGVLYEKGAEKFFDDCLDRLVNVKRIKVKKDGTSMKKLQVLSCAPNLTRGNILLTASGKYLYLAFDYSLRTRKQPFALTLKEVNSKYVATSLLNLKGQKQFPIGEPAIKIYAIDLQTYLEEIYYP